MSSVFSLGSVIIHQKEKMLEPFHDEESYTIRKNFHIFMKMRFANSLSVYRLLGLVFFMSSVGYV